MPRNKSLLKGRGGTSGGHKKIVIRPYQKPPTLPPNYYESTVKDLLQGTISVLEQKRAMGYAGSSNTLASPGDTTPTTQSSSSSSGLSLQNAYTAVVNLVSHQYGPRLYQDLRQSMKEACVLVLPDDQLGLTSASGTAASAMSTNNDALLRRIPILYQSYTEYLLCVKHIFLPLDRTHVWQADQQQVLPIRAGSTGPPVASTTTAAASSYPSMDTATSGGGTTSNNRGAFSPHAQQSLWQVGLAVWADRLAQLGVDKLLYQSWLQNLLLDWNPKFLDDSNMGELNQPSSYELKNLSCLQAVWYMWQDLGWLNVLPLQRDLEDYWRTQSETWASEVPYRPAVFLNFCYRKHQHIYNWPWLPSAWLMSIVEHCLLEPHLLHTTEDDNTGNSTAMNTVSLFLRSNKNGPTPGLLLQPTHFNPLLEEAMFGSKHNRVSASITPPILGTPRKGSSLVTNTNNSSHNSVAQLWLLAGRLPQGQTAVACAVAQFARHQGLARVQGGMTNTGGVPNMKSPPKKESSSTVSAVADLLELQDALIKLIRSLPQGNDLINLKNVWEEVVNQDTKPSVAESLAKFLDQILRSTKKLDQYQQESENWLVKIVSGVFVPLQAKDVFEAFYKKDLAKRLLWNRVVSMDVEKHVCSLLKAECGAAYTSKMEGMFQDVDWSRETMMLYKQSAAGQQGVAHSSMEMEVQVLTTGYWPVYPQYPNLQVPDSLRQQQDHFTNHYKTKYQGRRMTWQYALGHCVVRCYGFTRPYELIVSLCQAVVLLQFRSESRWTLPELAKVVGLEDRDEMERTLQSLSLGKDGTRILRKIDFDADPSKKTKVRKSIDDKDTFVIFEGFECNSRRIRINNIMMKETKEEREKTVEAVSRDRLYLIDAVLVRIMKARKSILHKALIPQVLEQVKVPAQPADVKKRIESLIEREYMERDPKDRNRYNYLA